MNIPCEMIRDLMPLYIDGVCGEATIRAVEKHLAECQACREYYESMKATVSVAKIVNRNSDETRKINSLKRIKSKLNRKMNRIVFGSIAAMLVVIFGIYLLCFAPIRNVSVEDISVSVDVYSTAELIENHDDKTTNIDIPEHGMSVTASAAEKFSHVSAMTIVSDCFLKDMKIETRENVIYITALRTTLLNNAGESVISKMCRLETEEIEKVVFIDDRGTETVLWKK